MRKLKLDELGRLSVEEYKNSSKMKVSVLLDNIRSMHNVGSVFRTVDAFRAEKIYLAGITGQPPHREINKTALGATESVDWEYIELPGEAIETLKGEGYEIVAVEQAEGSVSLDDFSIQPEKKYLLVFGNEVFGVSDEVMERCDTCLEIPQYGTKHSLNVSVSVGIVLREFSKMLAS
ncbi:MAG: RNA methyltransferase [Cyclobacteriaceae bacterium]|nr:RNA methyltransferase [Cyclobacteriaceae bacterium]